MTVYLTVTVYFTRSQIKRYFTMILRFSPFYFDLRTLTLVTLICLIAHFFEWNSSDPHGKSFHFMHLLLIIKFFCIRYLNKRVAHHITLSFTTERNIKMALIAAHRKSGVILVATV